MARKDTLYVSDMDGTLLGSDSRISEESREIITTLSLEGHHITVATARTPATVVPLLEGTLTLPPAIVVTGAALWRRGDGGGYEDVRYFSPELYSSLTGLFAAHGLSPFVYTLPGTDGIIHAYRNRLKRFHLSTAAPASAASKTMLFFAMGPLEPVMRAADYIRKSLPCAVSAYPDIFLSDTGILEVLAPGVSKAAAVKSLAERLGLSRIVAFGDNLNDLPMLAAADVAVAVENALPEVKAAATVVIGPNTASSVARFIAAD